MGPFSFFRCGHMFLVPYIEATGRFSNVGLLACGAIVFVDALLFEAVRFCLVPGAEDILKFLAGGDEGVAACLFECSFQLIGYPSWDKGNFSVRTERDAIIRFVVFFRMEREEGKEIGGLLLLLLLLLLLSLSVLRYVVFYDFFHFFSVMTIISVSVEYEGDVILEFGGRRANSGCSADLSL